MHVEYVEYVLWRKQASIKWRSLHANSLEVLLNYTNFQFQAQK